MPARVEEEPVQVARMMRGASYTTVPPATRSFSATGTSLHGCSNGPAGLCAALHAHTHSSTAGSITCKQSSHFPPCCQAQGARPFSPGLSGQHRLVHAAAPLHHLPVHRHAVPRQHPHQIPRLHSTHSTAAGGREAQIVAEGEPRTARLPMVS